MARRVEVMLSMLILIIVALFATHARNVVWQDEVSLWEDTISKSPGKARGYINLGKAFALKGYFDKALNVFAKGIELEPNDYTAYNDLGNVYSLMQQNVNALVNYSKSIDIAPNAKAYFNRCSVFYDIGQYDQAVVDCTKAIEIDNDYAKAYGVLANIYRTQREFGRAIEYYNKALSIESTAAESTAADAYYGRGVVYEMIGQHEKAVYDLRNACDLGVILACNLLRL